METTVEKERVKHKNKCFKIKATKEERKVT
jgi:hypothetical protein